MKRNNAKRGVRHTEIAWKHFSMRLRKKDRREDKDDKKKRRIRTNRGEYWEGYQGEYWEGYWEWLWDVNSSKDTWISKKEGDKEALRKRRKWKRMASRRIGVVTYMAEYQSFLIVCYGDVWHDNVLLIPSHVLRFVFPSPAPCSLQPSSSSVSF